MMRRDVLDAPIPAQATADPREVAYFASMADEWWNPSGRFRSLHQLNPVRLRFITARVARHFGRDSQGRLPLSGLRVLDIGCGGGLLSEAVAFLGADVVGIDATAKLVEVARVHAVANFVDIDYRHTLAEDLADSGARFDVVLNTEVVEHVANVDRFLESCCRLITPGGMMIVATLDRTLKSLLFAKIGGEYILRLLPRGTHDWNRFIRPNELAQKLESFGTNVDETVGVTYNPLAGSFRVSKDTSVNYMTVATRPKSPSLRVVDA